MRKRLCRYFTRREATEGPHGLFRYPAKYLPQVARAVLEEVVSPGEPVLDPFAGSGTTLVEAARFGVPSTGLDLNPLAVLLSRVKTTAADPAEILAAGAGALERASGLGSGDFVVPEFRNRDYWFPETSLAPLARIRRALDDEEEPVLRDLLLVVFLSIVKDCSNASSFHYKLTRSREPDPVTGADVPKLFARRLKKAAKRFHDFQPAAPARCLAADARRLPFPDDTFAAVVTHPPYSISFDFVRSFKIFLWWLDPARDTVALDKLLIGNQRRSTGEPPRSGIASIDAITDQVYERNARDGLAVGWFFTDMDRILAECRRVVRPGGALALYVGDSQARWTRLEAPANLAALAERAGFTLTVRLPRDVPQQVSSKIRNIHVEELLMFV